MLFSDAAKYILIEAGEIPEPLAEEMLRQSAIEFCSRSLIWRETLPDIDLISGQGTYTLSVPADTEPVEIVRMLHVPTGLQIEKRTDEQLMWGEAALPQTASQPEFFTYRSGAPSFTIYPSPASNVTAGIRTRVALRPTQDGPAIDDLVWNRWREAILDGARFRLHRIPRKPWTDGGAAELARQLFEQAIDQAFTEGANAGPISPRRRVSA